MTNKISLELTAAQTSIFLPRQISNVRKLRIEGYRYITASAGQKYMMITIANFTDNKFITGSKNFEYTKLMLLDSGSGVMVRYNNQDTSSFDSILNNPTDLVNFNISINIDGVMNSDITVSNPVMLSLHFE